VMEEAISVMGRFLDEAERTSIRALSRITNGAESAS
jgi:hypothetical protein